MMGPSRFCMELICDIGIDLFYHFNHEKWSWKPKTEQDVVYVLEQLQSYRPLINQYISNIKYGRTAGMVRSREDCEAGYYSFTRNFFKVYVHGSKGVTQLLKKIIILFYHVINLLYKKRDPDRN